MTTPWASEDAQRLAEGEHDTAALSNPSALTDNPHWQASLGSSRDLLAAALVALRAALAANLDEQSQTQALNVKLAKLQHDAAAQYRFIQRQVASLWLALDPSDPNTSPDLVAAREAAFDQIFNITPSALGRLRAANLAETLRVVARALEVHPELSPLALHPRLTALAADAHALAQSIKRERDEDKAATQALNTARLAFDRAARVHRLFVEAVLLHADRSNELGRFILSQDPRYRARRSAGLPISTDPNTPDDPTPEPS